MMTLQTQKKPLRLTFNTIAKNDNVIKNFINDYKINEKHKNAIIISIQHELMINYDIGTITMTQIESLLEKTK